MYSIAIPFRHRRVRQRQPLISFLRTATDADPRRWNIAVLSFLAALTVWYLALTNGNATAGYELRALERKASAFLGEVRRLELRGLNMQSIDDLTERVANQGYVPVAQIQYLSPSAGIVAQR